MNTKWTILLAKETMRKYLLGNLPPKSDLPGFIARDHSNVRELVDYNDGEFDKINQQALEDLLKIDIEELYTSESNLSGEILEAIDGEANEVITLDEVSKGEAQNFYTTLDLTNENVARAIGQYGYRLATSRGKSLEPILELLLVEPNSGYDSRVTKNAKEGWRDATYNYYKEMADGAIKEGEYHKDFYRIAVGSIKKITLTSAEDAEWGSSMADWLKENGHTKGIKEQKDLNDKPFYSLFNKDIKFSDMNEEDFFNFMNELGSVSPAKWKGFIQKILNQMVKFDTANPKVDGLTSEQLKTILGGSENFSNDIANYMEQLNPKTIIRGERRGSRRAFSPGEISNKPDSASTLGYESERGGGKLSRDDANEESDQKTQFRYAGEKYDDKTGRVIPRNINPDEPVPTILDTDIKVDTSIVEGIKTVEEDDLVVSINNALRFFEDNSRLVFDVKVNKTSKVYTITTKEQKWNPAPDFLNVQESKLTKINSPKLFTSKMNVDFNANHEVAAQENMAERAIVSLEEQGEFKPIKLLIELTNDLVESSDDIKRLYREIDKNVEEDYFNPLEEIQEVLDREDLLSDLESDERKDDTAEDFIPLVSVLNKVQTSFIQYIANSNKKDIVEEEEEEEESIIDETSDESSLLDDNDIATMKLLGDRMDSFSLNLRKVLEYSKPEPTTLEENEEIMERLFITEKGKTFKPIYEEILNGKSLERIHKPAIISALQEHFGLSVITDNDEEKIETWETYKRILESQNMKLEDIFLATITNQNTDERKWGQPARWDTEGTIKFKIIIREGSEIVIQSEVIYNQEFEIKVALTDGSAKITPYNKDQQSAKARDRQGKKTTNVTALGRDVSQWGLGTDKTRKDFIDKLEDRLQRLRSVI
tara:strand:+ start:568 stop:3210 length:2643 start_codon:yes stop_codon:yes gene_type:complete